MRRRANRPVLTRSEFAARFEAEKARQRRRYSDTFVLWQSCADKSCRRARACCGDANVCLTRVLAEVPRSAHWQAREDMLAALPRDIGAPERAARQCMPVDLFLDRGGKVAADYLARFKPKPHAPRYRRAG